MQSKHTDATINRPEGERIIDAPFVFADIGKYIAQLKKEEAWQKNDRNGITLVKAAGMTIVLTCLHENASFNDNSVDSLLTIQVLAGAIDFVAANRTTKVMKDQIVSLRRGIKHTITAKEETAILLTKMISQGE